MGDFVFDDGIYKGKITSNWGLSESSQKGTPEFYAAVQITHQADGGGVFTELAEPETRRVNLYLTPGTEDQVIRLLKTLGAEHAGQLDPNDPDAVDLYGIEVTVQNKGESFKNKWREKWSFAGSGSKPMSEEKKAQIAQTFRVTKEPVAS